MIGNDKEGNWYLIVAETSTSSKGLRGTDQLKLLNQLNITNAINLDGGGSSAMMVNNQFVTTKKGRNIPTAFIFR
jgi:exopolysaccharide biosynthesis protein